MNLKTTKIRSVSYEYILYDGGPMVVDFERARLCRRQLLGSIGSNGQNRKRKRGTLQTKDNDVFAKELQSVVEKVSEVFRCAGTV